MATFSSRCPRSVGARQPDRTEGYKPYGVHEAMWKHSSSEAWHQTGNFALYNAPPGTWQRMAVYFYLSPEDGRATRRDVMAYTHGDVFKPMPEIRWRAPTGPHRRLQALRRA